MIRAPLLRWLLASPQRSVQIQQFFSRAFQLFPVSQPGKPGEFDVESDNRVGGAERDNLAINVPNTPYFPPFTALDPADLGLPVEVTLLGDAERCDVEERWDWPPC